MADYQVTCIRKPNRFSPFERIQFLGGREGGGWRLTPAQVAAHITSGTHRFYVNEIGHAVYLKAMPPLTILGEWFVKTESDRDLDDNLLSLPDCP